MAFVEIGVGTAMLYGAAIGAGTGAIYSGVTGGNVLNGALIGAGIGGLGGAGAAGIAGASWAGAGAEAVTAANGIAASLPGGYASAAAALADGVAPEVLGLTQQQALALTASQGSNALGAAAAASTAAPTTPGTVVPAAAPTQVAGAPTYGILPGEGGNIGTLNGNVVYPDTGLTTPTIQSTPTAAELQALQVGGPQGPTTGGGIGGMFSGIGNFVKEHPYATAAGVGGLGYLLGSSGKSMFQPNYLPAYTPVSASQMGLNARLASNYKPVRAMADGGIASLKDGNLMQTGPAQVNFMGNDMYPQSQIQRSYYATPTQMPTSAQAAAASYEPKTNPLTGELTANMAGGGITAAGETGLQAAQQSMNPQYIQQLANQFNTTPMMAQQGLQKLQSLGIAKANGGSVGSKYNLGSYSDGGRLLKGPGDGMSDDIPASIADKQPARLADGEFVVPADVVSHLGNGSTDAGAKHLYKMMDNVRKARTGRKSQGKQIKADKYLPK
jgi:hypothetical protein